MAIKKTTTEETKKKAPAKEAKVKVVKEVKEKKEVKKVVKKEVKDVKEVKAVKEVKKETKDKEVKKETKAVKGAVEFTGKYFYAVGKRKTSIAQVRIYAVEKEAKGIVVNGKDVKEYFTIERHVEAITAPLALVGLVDKFDISVKVNGGGVMGQAEAAKLGVARALVVYDETLKKTLKDVGFLTRDARVVERKKPGKKKARKSSQWAKR
ncbi:MAG: 30S ribosomal protein S9 [Parcubacteria group bacterium]|jgi:small subunit ribosomal protein S9